MQRGVSNNNSRLSTLNCFCKEIIGVHVIKNTKAEILRELLLQFFVWAVLKTAYIYIYCVSRKVVKCIKVEGKKRQEIEKNAEQKKKQAEGTKERKAKKDKRLFNGTAVNCTEKCTRK